MLPSQAVMAEDSLASQAVTQPAIVAPSIEPLTATVPDIIMTAFATGDKLDVIEFYNQSSVAIWMGDVSIMTLDSIGNAQAIPLQSGFLLSKHYISFAVDTHLISGALKFGAVQRSTAADITKVSIMRAGSVTQSTNVPKNAGNVLLKDDYIWAQHKQRGNATLKQTGDFTTDFNRKITPLAIEGTELYLPTQSAGGLRIREIHANPDDCEPLAASVLNLACGDYIKVVNESANSINLTNYRLRVGAYGDSASIVNTFNWQQSTLSPEDEYILNAHDSFVVHLRDDLKSLTLTATGKYVWIEDYFGTTTYDSVQYPNMTLAQYTGSSWAYDTADAVWKAGIPSPGTVENTFPPVSSDMPTLDAVASTSLVACGANQYRSEETNRCRSLVTAVQTPCKEGQYRSEETNRCRSIVQTVAASIKSCGDDQFRNPVTGRCKKIASTDDIIQPCDPGWERNVQTNRCRKVQAASMPLAAFPVAPIAPTSSHAAVMLGGGGIVLGALAYAAWEWRREVGAGARILLGKLTTRR